MTLKSQEHSDLMEQFERQFRSAVVALITKRTEALTLELTDLKAHLLTTEAAAFKAKEHAYRMGYRAGWIDGDIKSDQVKEWEDGNWEAYRSSQAGSGTP